MNAWSAVGSVLKTGGDIAYDHYATKSKLNAEKQKATALERLRRETNSQNNQERFDYERQNIDYKNSLQPGGVDPETGVERSNKWISEHPDANIVGPKKYELDNRAIVDKRTADERIIEKYYNNDPDAYYAAKKQGNASGSMSPSDRAKLLLKVADSQGYQNAVMEAEAYNKEDTGRWKPGVQLRPEGEMKPIPSPEEYAISMGLLPYEQDAQGYTAPGPQTGRSVNQEQFVADVKKAANMIASGKSSKESLIKRFGADNEFTKSVLSQVGKTAVIDPEKVNKERSNPSKWNIMADAMGDALDFKINPAEAIGKAASATATSAAKNIPKSLKGIGKVAKEVYFGLSESAKAIVEANDKLKKKLTNVTTEADAKKFMDEVQKVIDADTYDYGTGNIYEPRPL